MIKKYKKNTYENIFNHSPLLTSSKIEEMNVKNEKGYNENEEELKKANQYLTY